MPSCPDACMLLTQAWLAETAAMGDIVLREATKNLTENGGCAMPVVLEAAVVLGDLGFACMLLESPLAISTSRWDVDRLVRLGERLQWPAPLLTSLTRRLCGRGPHAYPHSFQLDLLLAMRSAPSGEVCTTCACSALLVCIS